MRSLLSSTFGKICGDLPSTCIFLQTVLVISLTAVLSYLFVTQELLN
jgi:hypothetical protein